MPRLDFSIYKFFGKVAKTDRLILKDFGFTHLEQQQRMDMMEMIEDRDGRISTIIASQLPVALLETFNKGFSDDCSFALFGLSAKNSVIVPKYTFFGAQVLKKEWRNH